MSEDFTTATPSGVRDEAAYTQCNIMHVSAYCCDEASSLMSSVTTGTPSALCRAMQDSSHIKNIVPSCNLFAYLDCCHSGNINVISCCLLSAEFTKDAKLVIDSTLL